MAIPPLAFMYHLMVFPADVAVRFEVSPQLIVEGEAITLEGNSGIVFTTTATEAVFWHPFALVTVTI